jgi:hypothetical protein
MLELINACIDIIFWCHGMGGNDGIFLNDSPTMMPWEFVSKVGAGGCHVSSAKNFGMIGGHSHLWFKYLQCAHIVSKITILLHKGS